MLLLARSGYEDVETKMRYLIKKSIKSFFGLNAQRETKK